MKKRLALFLAPALLLSLAACDGESRQREISRILGTDVSDGEIVEEYDSHGGFHGDGYTCVILRFPEGTELLPPEREELPLTENLADAVYGGEEERNGGIYSRGPLGSDDAPEVPPIEHGWYWFYDRHQESTDPRDDSMLWDRNSFNYTLALYDADSALLYYMEFDT